MDFFKRHKITGANILKLAGIVLGAIIVLTLASTLFRFPSGMMGRGQGFDMTAPSFFGESYDVAPMYDKGMVQSAGMPATDSDYGGVNLSIRNLLPTPPFLPPYPRQGSPIGNNAEDFEVTDYNATIETRHLEKTCAIFTELRERTYVIFENATESDHTCNFTFKVEHASVPEVLTAIEELDPRDLSKNSYTIKRQIDDFTSEAEILQKKRTSIDETLRSALAAYEEITRLASRTANAEALAKIIDSKIGVIERLTRERISIEEQLDRLARAKEEQLDRLTYTYFNVNVYENELIDGERIADSWKAAFRELVESINLAVQFVSVKLLAFLLWLLPIALYLFVILLLAKYGWRIAKGIWRR